MSLKFLSKKGWNPSNLKNVEKVWLAEHKVEEEEKRMQELRKQIAEERQLQELKELQVKAGLVDKDQAQKLDWMYEGPMATMQDHQENTEHYLLGKEVSLKAQESEVKKVESQPGMLFLNSVSAKNDMFTRLHEDPLLLIKQNELKKREDVVKNPVKMARIRQQLEAEMAAKKEKKKRKKEKKRARKEAKKSKKKDKDREHHHKRGASSESSEDSSVDEAKDKSGKSGEPPKRRRLDSRSRSPTPRRRSRSRSRSRSRNRDRSSRGGGRDRDRDESSRSRRRSPTPPHRQAEQSRKRSHDRRSPARDHAHAREYRRRHDSDDEEGGERGGKKYGLQTANGATKLSGDDGRPRHLGPDPALLAAKEKERQEQERLKTQARRKQPMTEEERKRRLAEMQQDGSMNEEKRRARVEEGRHREKEEDARDVGLTVEHKRGAEKDMKPAFLDKLVQGNSESIEDRLQTLKHTRQRGGDGGFL